MGLFRELEKLVGIEKRKRSKPRLRRRERAEHEPRGTRRHRTPKRKKNGEFEKRHR